MTDPGIMRMLGGDLPSHGPWSLWDHHRRAYLRKRLPHPTLDQFHLLGRAAAYVVPLAVWDPPGPYGVDIAFEPHNGTILLVYVRHYLEYDLISLTDDTVTNATLKTTEQVDALFKLYWRTP